MNNPTDQQLLRDFATRRSDAAFAELVRRHVDLVYSAALRMVCDAHLAEDMTQGAFVALAQNARQLTARPVLSGWLHRTTQNLAANAVRSDVRRRTREQEAAAMNQLLANESDANWENIAPHLDAALGDLNEADRDAVLLRYFEKKSAREMAQILGTSEDAAQKRVSRAVERLREFFSKQKITIGASGLIVLVSANAVQSAPLGLALTITNASLAAAGTTLTVMKIATMTKLRLALCAIVVAGAVTAFVVQQQNQTKLRGENESLQQQIAQLQADNAGLFNRIAAIGEANQLPAEQFNELLKLRGEVGVLRRQLDELAKKNRALQNVNTAMLGSNTNPPAPQIHIKSRFIEVSQDDNKSLGFDWYLGNFVNGQVVGNGGSAPSLTVPVSAVNPLGTFHGNTASSIVSPSATFMGILTDLNFGVAIRALEQRSGTKILGEPEVTLTSGHPVQMRATQTISVVTNFCLQEINGTSITVPQTENVETGPVLNAMPRVLPDGYTIELPVIASVVEFLGYAQSTNTTPAYNSAGQEIDVPTLSPQFRVQSTTNSVNLFDDQTLVFGLKDNQDQTDAALAELDGSKSNSLNRHTLVFVTATIIDPAGNRVHEDASYTNIPPQPVSQ